MDSPTDLGKPMEAANTPALLLLDLPNPALVGIDLLAFTTSPRFRGVKDLPVGFHFAFVATSTTSSERHGIWFNVPPVASSFPSAPQPSLTVAKWDPTIETLLLVNDDAELLRCRAHLGALWREALSPYNPSSASQQSNPDWPSLTSQVSPKLLSRVLGPEPTQWRLSSASSSAQDIEIIPGLTHTTPAHPADEATESELHFLPIDLKQTWRAGATGRERTNAARDRSWALAALVGDDDPAPLLLAELQLAFLMALTLSNYSCAAQWRRLATLLLTCTRAVRTRPAFFASALALLRAQARLSARAAGPAGLIDFDEQAGSGAALPKRALERFRGRLDRLIEDGDGDDGVADVLAALDALEDELANEHGWVFGGAGPARAGVLVLPDGEEVRFDKGGFDDEDEETGEFAPVVVDLTPEQARMLGVGDGVVVGTEREEGESDGSSIDDCGTRGGNESSGEEEDEAGSLEDIDARY